MERHILALFPDEFRERFGQEWLEAIRWRRSKMAGSVGGRLRFIGHLLLDSVRALPSAHLFALRARLRRSRPGSEVVRSGDRVWRGRRGPSPDSLGEDLRQVARGLRRSRLFTIVAVASIALGVAANTAIFSVVNGVLLEPLPYADADRLTIVWNEFPESGLSRLPLSGVGIEELRAQPGLFESVGGIWGTTRTVADGTGSPIQVSAGVVTADFFDVLGVRPAVGVAWEPGGAEPVPEGVVISDALWRGPFGADPALIGQRIQVNGAPATVIGVMPPSFRLHFPPDGSIPETLDVFVPLPWDLTLLPPDQHFLRVVARLRAGVSLESARTGAREAADRARSKYSELTATGDRYSVAPLQADAIRSARPVLLALLAGVGLFLLLAAANVGNMVMARTTARRSEFAVRSALGASGGRLAQLVMLESLVVAIAGGLAGIWLGAAAGRLLWALRPPGITTIDAVPFDGRVVAYAVAATVVAAIVFGLAPVLSAARVSAHSTLRAAGVARDTGPRLRQSLTVAGVALALVLLVGAGLVGRTLVRLQGVDPGFDAGGVLTFRLSLPSQIFPSDAERSQLATEVERRLHELPDVAAVGATSHLPLTQWANWGDTAAPDRVAEDDRDAYFVDHRSVTPGYKDAMGVRLLEGRWFEPTDGPLSQPVVIIDRAFADRAFPEGDPVGKVLNASRYLEGDFQREAAVVIGVVDNVRDVSLTRPSQGQLFWPFSQAARWELTFVVSTRSDAASFGPVIENSVRAVHGALVPARIVALDDYVSAATEEARFVALMGGLFSVLALVLASVGLYGVVMYLAVRRAREFGLRLVLGARPGTLTRAVVADGLRLGLTGVFAGVLLSLGLTRLIGSFLFDVSPWDPVTFATMAGLLVVITMVASFLPARRAARTDPMAVLRSP
jgi:putative ABC transport system permease protein